MYSLVLLSCTLLLLLLGPIICLRWDQPKLYLEPINCSQQANPTLSALKPFSGRRVTSSFVFHPPPLTPLHFFRFPHPTWSHTSFLSVLCRHSSHSHLPISFIIIGCVYYLITSLLCHYTAARYGRGISLSLRYLKEQSHYNFKNKLTAKVFQTKWKRPRLIARYWQ
jgi:hypothetical protein